MFVYYLTTHSLSRLCKNVTLRINNTLSQGKIIKKQKLTLAAAIKNYILIKYDLHSRRFYGVRKASLGFI